MDPRATAEAQSAPSVSPSPLQGGAQEGVRSPGASSGVPSARERREIALREIEDLRSSGRAAALNLSGLNLVDVDLSGLDLTGSDLSGADLSRAKLAGATLFQVSLRGATMFRADLSKAELSAADLTGANLEEARLDGAGLGFAVCREASFVHADLHGATLSQADLSAADLRMARLEGSRLCSAVLVKASLAKANLSGADLTEADVEDAVLDGADLRESTLRSLRNFQKARWIGVDLREIDFTGAHLCRRFILDQNFIEEFRTQGRWSEWAYRIWWLTSDCGRSMLRWSFCTAVLAFLFAGIYPFLSIDYGDHPTSLSPVYYSVVTLTTLGYGDVVPSSVPAQIVAMIEVVTGYFMLGGLLSILSNKLARRAD